MKNVFTRELLMTWKLWTFGFIKIPLILFCRPRIIRVDEQGIEVKINLNRRTRNHLKSMYFGVLSIGADVTGGFLAMQQIAKSKSNISLIFKDFHVDFLKRAEDDVHFICSQAKEIKMLVEKAKTTGERHSMPIQIIAIVPKLSTEVVAKFILTLSIKKNN